MVEVGEVVVEDLELMKFDDAIDATTDDEIGCVTGCVIELLLPQLSFLLGHSKVFVGLGFASLVVFESLDVKRKEK